jgi:glycine hydroxymethyltransferase
VGGRSSNRLDRPAGIRGLRAVGVPMNPKELVIDREASRCVADRERPKLVALRASMTLFPFPLAELRRLADEFGFTPLFRGSPSGGLCAGGQFQDPLAERRRCAHRQHRQDFQRAAGRGHRL